jgi:hypothetical protein
MAHRLSTFACALLFAGACASATGKQTGDPIGPEETGGSGPGDTGGRGGSVPRDAGTAAGGATGGRDATGGTGEGGSGPAPDAGTVPDSGASPDAPPSMPPAPGACAKLLKTAGPASQWVSWDENGKLVYKALNPQGDRIMDFSYAGYRGGGVALPEVPVAVTLSPSGGDDTAAIQGALDEVSKRPLVNGFRGAVLLKPGVYKSGTQHAIAASGVVLRGSGSGMGGTEIQLTGAPHRFLVISGTAMRMTDAASKTTITDAYVPAGARTFTVASAAAFKAGDEILVGRPVTAAWVHFMGMDTLVRNGQPQTWLTPGSVQNAERTITAVAGNKITIDIPLSDSLDGQYVTPPGATITKFSYARPSEIGVEHLRVVGQPRSETVNFNFVSLNSVVDSWVKDTVAHDVTGGVNIGGDSKRITVEDTTITHTMVDYVSAAKPSDFGVDGFGQVLISRSAARGANQSFSMITQSGVPGQVVLLNFGASGIGTHLQPHQRWSTGLLVDNANMEAGNIELIDRNILGSGHGWTMGWGVVWNSIAPSIKVQQPPGTMNWAIGCKGNMAAPSDGHPNGTYDSHGTPVNIKSLYLAQLCERLGPQAVANIGF